MNFFKRGIISISRNRYHSIAFFLLIFILGCLMSGSLSIRQAIQLTERNLLDNIPAIATLDMDMEAIRAYIDETGEWPPNNQLTFEMVQQVQNLSYVRDYTLTMRVPNMFSRDLHRTLELSLDTSELNEEWNEFLKRDFESLRTRGFNLEIFNLLGVGTPKLMEIQTENMVIKEGRTFTQNEIDNKHHVALISRTLAQANNLSVGSTFTMENIVFDYREQDNEVIWETQFNDEFILKSESLEFEVVGIFELIGLVDPQENRRLQNQIYVPLSVVQDIVTFQINGAIEIYGESAQPDTGVDEWFDSMFILHNPRDLPKFRSVVEEILPEFWTTVDLTSTFSGITVAMDQMLWIANLIFFGGIAAIIVITSLAVTLFLRDRKHEIGILLALGERKRNVIIQIIFEVMSLSIIAFILSSFSGNLLSRGISRQMLENQVIQAHNEIGIIGSSGTFEGFNDVSMSIEDMMRAYEVSLDPQILLIIYSTGVGIILLSTIIPIIYIIRLNPKKILM